MTRARSIRPRPLTRPDPERTGPPPLGGGPWQLSAVALDVAGACNLSCRYCAEAATQPRRKRMPERVLNAAWHLLLPDDIPRTGTSIRLGSGEPLLAFNRLKSLATLIAQSGGCAAENRPTVFLTTNGTLAGREIRDWLVMSGWHVKVSLDGPGLLHDRWRVTRSGNGTFSKVSETVAELARRMPDRFSVTAVLCRGADPKVVFQAIADLGVRRIELVPVAHRDRHILPGKEELKLYQRFVREYAMRHTDVRHRDLPMLVRFENSVQRILGYSRCRVPCGAGRTFVGVGPGGALYPCFRLVGIENYRLGGLPEGLDSQAVHTFEHGAGRSYDQRFPCSRCWAGPFCGGPCFAVAEMFGKRRGEPLELHCEYTRADIKSARWLVEQLRKRDPERLLEFLPGVVKAQLPPE